MTTTWQGLRAPDPEWERKCYGCSEQAVLDGADDWIGSPLRFGQAPRDAAADLVYGMLSDAQDLLTLKEPADQVTQQLNRAKLILSHRVKATPGWGKLGNVEGQPEQGRPEPERCTLCHHPVSFSAEPVARGQCCLQCFWKAVAAVRIAQEMNAARGIPPAPALPPPTPLE